MFLIIYTKTFIIKYTEEGLGRNIYHICFLKIIKIFYKKKKILTSIAQIKLNKPLYRRVQERKQIKWIKTSAKIILLFVR